MAPAPQHGWPAAPHGSQVVVTPASVRPVMQSSPVWQAAPPPPRPQHAWPIPPHAWQEAAAPFIPAAHAKPLSHVPRKPAAPPPPQHAWPEPPHAVHVPPIPIITPVQVAPSAQTLPGQHAAPAAQAMHVLGMLLPGLAQPRPALQVAPAQQAWPLAPHAPHVSMFMAPWQDRPDAQRFAPWPPQHAPPEVPQATHVDGAPIAPARQTAPGAVQEVLPPPPAPPPQQGSPTAPHRTVPPSVPSRWHDPLEHVPAVPPPMHSDPLAVQVPPVQQPPALQVLAAQQGWLVPPQFAPGVPPPELPPPPQAPTPRVSTTRSGHSDFVHAEIEYGLILLRLCAGEAAIVIASFLGR
jgi:hypothetical protein